VSVDVDNHEGGPDGRIAWAEMLERNGPLPVTAADDRGHCLFRALPNPWPKTAWKLAPAVELLPAAPLTASAPWTPTAPLAVLNVNEELPEMLVVTPSR
jgi:hypothetical protein